jgi:uncharacterized protein YbcV (DUF1398 family)
MNAQAIVEAAHSTHAGTASFPEIVAKLVAAGVESYHVDYICMRTTFYGSEGAVVVTPIPFEGMPSVAASFETNALKAAIVDSQQHGQKYREFTRRAMEAGVQCYFAFLRGKRVTYLGRSGDQHTEWFPGAAPAQP